MSHILIQMDDRRPPLDELDVQPADADEERSPTGPHEQKPRFRRLALIVPVKDYRTVSG
jgi:hypothetical protein